MRVFLSMTAMTVASTAALAAPPPGNYTYTPVVDPQTGAAVQALGMAANGDLVGTEPDGTTVVISKTVTTPISLPAGALAVGITDQDTILASLPFDQKTQHTQAVLQTASGQRLFFTDPKTSFDFSPNAVNDAGTVVGSEARNGVQSALDFVRNAKTGAYSRITVRGAGSSTETNAISNSGVIVGGGLNGAGRQFAYIRSASGNVLEFGIPQTSGALLYAVDDGGDAAGLYGVPGSLATIPFVRSAAGGIVSVPGDGGTQGYTFNVRAIDNAGEILLLGNKSGRSVSFIAKPVE